MVWEICGFEVLTLTAYRDTMVEIVDLAPHVLWTVKNIAFIISHLARYVLKCVFMILLCRYNINYSKKLIWMPYMGFKSSLREGVFLPFPLHWLVLNRIRWDVHFQYSIYLTCISICSICIWCMHYIVFSWLHLTEVLVFCNTLRGVQNLNSQTIFSSAFAILFLWS